MLDDPQQALAGADQPLEHTGRTALAFISLVLNADAHALLQAYGSLGSDGPLCAVVGCAGSEALFRQGLHKVVLGLIFAVHHEHTFWFLLKGVHPPQQTFSVRMAGHAGELAQFCLHLNRFTEQFYRRGTFQ